MITLEIVRLISRLLFWPIGLVLLGGTALIEFLSGDNDWQKWISFNAPVLKIMGLRRFVP